VLVEGFVIVVVVKDVVVKYMNRLIEDFVVDDFFVGDEGCFVDIFVVIKLVFGFDDIDVCGFVVVV